MSRFTKGQLVEVAATFTTDDIPTDPTLVVFRVIRPFGPEESYTYGVDSEVIKSSTGLYKMDILCDDSGEFWYRVEGTGMVTDAFEGSFLVRSSPF